MPRATASPATPAAEPGPLRRLAEELGLHLSPGGAGVAPTCPLHELHDHPIERRTDDENHRHCDPQR